MSARLPVSRINGTRANGMPNDNITCESTSARVGSTPLAKTARAGIRVTNRRTRIGNFLRSRPAMIIAPA